MDETTTDETTSWEPQNLPDKKIKEIAADLHAGRIFCDRHLQNPKRELKMVFMTVALLMGSPDGEKFMKVITEGKVGMIYEYLDKAGPLSCNGLPMFMSFRVLTPGDTEKVLNTARKMEEAIKGVSVD